MNFNQPLIGWKVGPDRMKLACEVAKGKRVLHVGSADEGITGRETLHERLGKVATSVFGVDVVAPCDLVWDFQRQFMQDDPPPWGEPEIVVCTEVLEHLDAVGPFLQNLRGVAPMYFFTVPNAFSRAQYLSAIDGKVEFVHPDHRCWFSPYTLENVLKRAGYEPIEKWMVGWTRQTSMFTMEGVAILCR